MTPKTDLSKMYDTLLSVPGMSETIKIDFKLPRKNILILNKVIERGMQKNSEDKEELSIIEMIPGTILDELRTVATELLQRAGLSEMNEKLDAFY